MNTEIIIALIGVASTFISGFSGWFFARKKYNSEVDNNLIANMQESLNFYKQLSDDNRARLDEVLKRNEELEKRDDALEREVRELRTQMFNLMGQICLDLTCKIRQREANLFKEKNK